MSPTEWFDKVFQQARPVVWPENSMWCQRHWSPCPVLGANGTGAATELLQIFTDELAVPGLGTSPAALNAQLKHMSPICCRLGDARMYALWGNWSSQAITDFLNKNNN